MRLRLAAVSALVLGGGVLTACGDSDPYLADWSDRPPPSGSDVGRFGGTTSSDFPYTGEQVFALFYMQGLYLARGPDVDVISLNTVASQQARDAVMARYGYFTVYIAHRPGEVERLLTDSTTGRPLQPDARGIYWFHDPGMLGLPASWRAFTRYANVVAAWMSGTGQRTDEHWDRMTAELDRLPPA
jgi:hypothetical protein